MASSASGYEIFATARGREKLFGVEQTKDNAREAANAIFGQKDIQAVRVVYSRFNAQSGLFDEMTVITLGEPAKVARAHGGYQIGDERLLDLKYCQTPEDLRLPLSRYAIYRVLRKYLETDHRLPIELLHDPDYYKTLFDKPQSPIYNSIHRISLAQKHDHGVDPKKRIKELETLIGQAVFEVETASKSAPAIVGRGLLKAIDAAGTKPDAATKVFVAINAGLSDVKTWQDKLTRLMAMAQAEPDERELRYIDAVAADLVTSDRAIGLFIGEAKRPFDRLSRLITLSRPERIQALDPIPVPDLNDDLAQAAVAQLLTMAGAGKLPEFVRSFLRRASHEIADSRRLTGTFDEDVREEAAAIGQLARMLPQEHEPTSYFATLQADLERRSQSLVAELTTLGGIARANTLIGRADLILTVARGLVGEEAHRILAKTLAYAYETHEIVESLFTDAGHPTGTLLTLAKHRRMIEKSGFPKKMRLELLDRLDDLVAEFLVRKKYFAHLEKLDREQRLRTLLHLMREGAFGKGKGRAAAEKLIYISLKGATELFNKIAAEFSHDAVGKAEMLRLLTVLSKWQRASASA